MKIIITILDSVVALRIIIIIFVLKGKGFVQCFIIILKKYVHEKSLEAHLG